jgi:hypothetical protein
VFSFFMITSFFSVLAVCTYGVVRMIGAQHLLTRETSVMPIWRSELGGVTIERGSRRWELYPTQAIVDGRTLLMAAYAVTTERTSSELSEHRRITILGIQIDGNEIVLLEGVTESPASWGGLIRAVESIKVVDPGTEADIPDALKALTQREQCPPL